MKHRMLSRIFGAGILAMSFFDVAHEKTGWRAPEEAMKMKNPIKPTKESIEKGKGIYEQRCASCHGAKGDGKGPAGAALNPKPTSFRESHGEKMTDGQHFWKITTGRGPMPSFAKDLKEEERWHVINYINTPMKHK